MTEESASALRTQLVAGHWRQVFMGDGSQPPSSDVNVGLYGI